MQVEGVLTAAECGGVIAAAEELGFQHQSSRGPAYGEVCYKRHGIPVFFYQNQVKRFWECLILYLLFGI